MNDVFVRVVMKNNKNKQKDELGRSRQNSKRESHWDLSL
jgi:hypothetical protein